MSGGGRAGAIEAGVKYRNLSDTYIQSSDEQTDRALSYFLLLIQQTITDLFSEACNCSLINFECITLVSGILQWNGTKGFENHKINNINNILY